MDEEFRDVAGACRASLRNCCQFRKTEINDLGRFTPRRISLTFLKSVTLILHLHFNAKTNTILRRYYFPIFIRGLYSDKTDKKGDTTFRFSFRYCSLNVISLSKNTVPLFWTRLSIFRTKSNPLKETRFSKLDARAKLLKRNPRERTYRERITNVIIRTFILACANFSFVRSHSVCDPGSSFERFIKLTRLIGRIHYSMTSAG